jgi:hypothetical protein
MRVAKNGGKKLGWIESALNKKETFGLESSEK